MFQNKTDILLLLYIGVLIFAEKIFDNHHAYNRRSITKINSRDEILSYLINSTCIISVVKFMISIFTCRILNTWCSIVKFLENKADWNILKVRCNGKYESEIFYFFF